MEAVKAWSSQQARCLAADTCVCLRTAAGAVTWFATRSLPGQLQTGHVRYEVPAGAVPSCFKIPAVLTRHDCVVSQVPLWLITAARVPMNTPWHTM